MALTPNLAFLRFPVGNVYLWHDDDGLTLIDCGVPGSAPSIEAAIRSLGRQPSELRHLVLTHFHADHVGSAAEVAGWGDVQVCAHAADASFIEGSDIGSEATLLDWEVPIRDSLPPIETPAPVRVNRRLADGDVLDFAGGARAVAVPGHTPGSVAIHLPAVGALFTGDTIARTAGGRIILGVFNVDREQAVASMRKQAALDVEIVGFGHGEPVTADAAAQLRVAASTLE